MQTKKEFEQFFKSQIETEIPSDDKPALRQAWNDFIDKRIRCGELPKRAGNWSHPARFYNKNDRPKKVLKPSKPKLKRGDIIQIIGRRWFDRVNGNTYHSSELLVNGILVFREPYQYGYDSQYEYTALRWLQSNYQMPKKWSDMSPVWRLRDYGITVNSSVSDVSRKKDL